MITSDPISFVDAMRIAAARAAQPSETLDHEIHGPYLRKWLIERADNGSAQYVHQFLRSDADGEFHDHPWDNRTLVVEGGYWDVTPTGRRWIGPGDRVTRNAGDFHRVELEPGICPITIFEHGPKIQSWGFLGTSGVKVSPEEFMAGSGAMRH